MKMGAGQFLRDFRRDYHITKSLAHRKAVLQRKAKAEERKLKVSFQRFELDRSVDKRSSHIGLLALVSKLGHNGVKRLYTKKELQTLCLAYGVPYKSSWNKEKLSSVLSVKVSECTCVPYPPIMSRYEVNTTHPQDDNAGQIPTLRIRRI